MYENQFQAILWRLINDQQYRDLLEAVSYAVRNKNTKAADELNQLLKQRRDQILKNNKKSS
jgi:hypothetical protein